MGALAQGGLDIEGENADGFVDYIFLQDTSSSNENVIPLAGFLCGMVGILNNGSSFEKRCTKFAEALERRMVHLRAPREPALGKNCVQIRVLFDTVLDQHILLQYQHRWGDSMVLSFKDFCQIISLHPAEFPGLLAGVTKAEVKEIEAKAKKSKLFTNAQHIKGTGSAYDDDWEDESPRRKRCVPVVYLEWFLCTLILAMLAATVLAGNWAIAQMLVRDSMFSEAGAYWTTAAIDMGVLICLFLCWLQCCSHSSTVCSVNMRSATHYMPQRPRSAMFLPPHGPSVGRYNGRGGATQMYGMGLLPYGGPGNNAIDTSGRSSFRGQGQRAIDSEKGISSVANDIGSVGSSGGATGRISELGHDGKKIEVLGLPKWANPGASPLLGGTDDMNSPQRIRSGASDDAALSTQHSKSRSRRRPTKQRISDSQMRRARGRGDTQLNVVMAGHLYKQSQRGKWSTQPRYCELVDLRKSPQDTARGVLACISVTSRRNKEKPFDITDDTWVDAMPRRVDAPQNYVFEVVTRSRNYRFCAETSRERDAWVDKLRVFIRVENDQMNHHPDRTPTHKRKHTKKREQPPRSGEYVSDETGDYRSDDSEKVHISRNYFPTSSGDDHYRYGEDDEDRSQQTEIEMEGLDTSHVLSDEDMDMNLTNQQLKRQQRPYSRKSSADVDATLRDLQGMLDDDDTWR